MARAATVVEMTETPTDLVGTPVRISVSDPWEFGTEVGTAPFAATIVEPGPDMAWIDLELETRIAYGSSSLGCFRASARHAGTDLLNVARGQRIVCNFQAASEREELQSESSSGVVLLIGGIELIRGGWRHRLAKS